MQGSIKEKTRYLSQGFSALCRNTNYCTFYCLEKGVSGKVAFYKNLPVRLLFPLHHLILDISYDSFAVYNRTSDTQKAWSYLSEFSYTFIEFMCKKIYICTQNVRYLQTGLIHFSYTILCLRHSAAAAFIIISSCLVDSVFNNWMKKILEKYKQFKNNKHQLAHLISIM